ncbi:hypothetical protein ACFQ46_08890 [Kineococcus sp. GCM10028916]
MLTVLTCVALVAAAVCAAIRMEAVWLTPPASPDARRPRDMVPVSPGGQV